MKPIMRNIHMKTLFWAVFAAAMFAPHFPNAASIVKFSLALVNKDRTADGVSAVELGRNPAAQMHADEMAAHCHLSHWWLDGRKPYMVYSQTGGKSYADENAAMQWSTSCSPQSMESAVQSLHYGMMHDDAASDWGHRRNILNPAHRAVNFGVAASCGCVAFVQHFEGGSILADHLPALTMSGDLSMAFSKSPNEDVSITAVSLHFDPEPTPKTPAQISALRSYGVGGGFTEEEHPPIANVLRPLSNGAYYLNFAPSDVLASSWIETESTFAVAANLGPLAQLRGVYTITVFGRLGKGADTIKLAQLSADRAGPRREPTQAP